MADKTDLEAFREWISSFPDFPVLERFQVDYTDQIPCNGGLFPSGLVELSRKEDILGNITVTNQYNFALYYIFQKSPGDDFGATENAEWLIRFQKWVQEQGIRNSVPKFGNTETRQIVKAQNGALYEQDEEGTAVYMVQVSVQYEMYYEVI